LESLYPAFPPSLFRHLPRQHHFPFVSPPSPFFFRAAFRSLFSLPMRRLVELSFQQPLLPAKRLRHFFLFLAIGSAFFFFPSLSISTQTFPPPLSFHQRPNNQSRPFLFFFLSTLSKMSCLFPLLPSKGKAPLFLFITK